MDTKATTRNPMEIPGAITELTFFDSDKMMYKISRVGIKGNSYSENRHYFGQWRVIRNPASVSAFLLNPEKDVMPLLAGLEHEGPWISTRFEGVGDEDVNHAIFFDTPETAYAALVAEVGDNLETLG